MMLELGLLISGVIIATVVMAIGIGGGILWTPLLILAFGASPQEAVVTSLLIQVVGMASGSLAYLRSGLVDFRLSLLFFAVALPGVVLGSLITERIPQGILQMALGIMAMLLALLFVASADSFDEGRTGKVDRKRLMRVLPIPGVFGVTMGFLSLGIGEWLIPALRSQLKISMNRAIATVIPMTFMLVLIASMVHWSQDSESLRTELFIWGAAGTLIGGQIGPRISQRINEQLLKETFIYLMTLVGIHLIFQAF